jgi:hypothetical protein
MDGTCTRRAFRGTIRYYELVQPYIYSSCTLCVCCDAPVGPIRAWLQAARERYGRVAAVLESCRAGELPCWRGTELGYLDIP